jgi:hypothetical protein
MGFFSGRVSYARYKVNKRTRGFGADHIDRLAAHAIGRQRQATADGTDVGWTAGDDILDTDFDLAKNIVDDTLHFAIRIDTQKLPGDLLRAYARAELKALAADNPSGLPSNRQRREARDAARERLEKEAKDGRFIRRKVVPVLWDAQAGELLVGSTSTTLLDRLHPLFLETFGTGFESLGAGRLAFSLAEARQQARGVDDARPSPFVPHLAAEFAWIPDERSRDFLGNEFLLWLWYVLDAEDDTLDVLDGSSVTVMVANSLVLECPRGQTGRESIRSEGPARLPEAHRAIQVGKLPRQAGLTLVRHEHQYELTLHAETLAVTGARLPATEEEDERARLEERVGQLRHLRETLDLLYDAFGQRRCGSEWSKELSKIQKWLQRDPRARTAAG